MVERDFYSELGVVGEFDDVSLRRSFKRATADWNPEKFPGNSQVKKRFERLRTAYDTLRDPKKRALYDEFGEVSLKPSFDPEWERERRARAKEREEARKAREAERREREQAAVKRRAKAALVSPTAVPLEDGRPGWAIRVAIGPRAARSGGYETVRVTRPEKCRPCDGSGRKPINCPRCKGEKKLGGVRLETCEPCHGVGLVAEHGDCKHCHGTGVRQRRRCKFCGGFGRAVQRFTCASCKGRGFLVIHYEVDCPDCSGTGLKPCMRCDGQGTVPVERPLRLNVPAGVDQNAEYRYAGAGFAVNPEDPQPDLFVRFVLVERAPPRKRSRRRRRRYWY